jgi:hypothetical protein
MSWFKSALGMGDRDDTAEGHFRLVVYLTVFFFVVTIGIEVLNASGLWAKSVDPVVAKEAFHDFFLVAIGMARASRVEGDKPNGNGENSNQGG